MALIGLMLTLLAATPTRAQQVARVEISRGYLALSAGAASFPTGYYVDVVANVNSWLGVVVATDGAYRNYSFEHVSFTRGTPPSGIDPSFELAASLRRASHYSQWRWAAQAGVGTNVAIGSQVGARVGLDYRRLQRVPRDFVENETRDNTTNQLIFAAGAVWMLGN